MKALAISLFAVIVLSGCSGAEDDLDLWMKEKSVSVKGSVEPLPELKPFVPFIYNADNSLVDPFGGHAAVSGEQGLNAPPEHVKEVLEAYPLESIKFVGHLLQGERNEALMAAPDNNVYRIKIGNYMGQNNGIVSSITSDEIIVKEFVQDGTGVYVERLVTINPQGNE